MEPEAYISRYLLVIKQTGQWAAEHFLHKAKDMLA